MRLYLVHHADAVGPGIDTRRPLSDLGHAQAARLAERAAQAGCAPAAIWHSGKLRARQTAEAFYRRCNPFADMRMVAGLLPDDSPRRLRDLLIGEPRDVLAVGHMPNIFLALRDLAPETAEFPIHGVVALETADEGRTWTETWRASPE